MCVLLFLNTIVEAFVNFINKSWAKIRDHVPHVGFNFIFLEKPADITLFQQIKTCGQAKGEQLLYGKQFPGKEKRVASNLIWSKANMPWTVLLGQKPSQWNCTEASRFSFSILTWIVVTLAVLLWLYNYFISHKCGMKWTKENKV